MSATDTEMPRRGCEPPGAGHSEVSQVPAAAYKRCSLCGESKPQDMFYTKSARCRACHLLAGQAWREQNRERNVQNARRWRERNPEKQRMEDAS